MPHKDFVGKMDDQLKPGCTITLEVLDLYYYELLMKWTPQSGLSNEYLRKILATKMDGTKWKLKFDNTANCFEAMQQITSDHHKIISMSCPCGKFVKITISPDFDDLQMRPKIEQFQQYGAVVDAKRTTDDSGLFHTGGFELIMFVKLDSEILTLPWINANQKKFKVEQYVPMKDKRIPIEIVNALWKKYGCFANLPDVEKTEIGHKKLVNGKIAQVD